MIKIDTVDLPTPSDFKAGVEDIVKAERNARGTMIMERIATKRKLELTWSYLSAAQLSAVLTAVSPIFFSVTYPDPVTNSNRTMTAYCGPKSTGMIDYRNGVARYKDVKFSLIER